MNESTANPLVIGLFFILRCLVPLLLMLGISYLLRRLGLIQPPSKPPADWETEINNETDNDNHTNSGSLAHGKL